MKIIIFIIVLFGVCENIYSHHTNYFKNVFYETTLPSNEISAYKYFIKQGYSPDEAVESIKFLQSDEPLAKMTRDLLKGFNESLKKLPKEEPLDAERTKKLDDERLKRIEKLREQARDVDDD